MRISDWSSDVCSSDLGDMLQLVGANTFLRIGNQGLAKMTVDGGTISNEGTASITTLGNIDEAEYRVEVVVENGGQIDAGNELHIGGGYGQATLTLMTGDRKSTRLNSSH